MIDKQEQDMKNAIIQSTIQEIAENGYINIFPRKIAEKNNISTATLYKYFNGKDGLLTETLVAVSKLVFTKYTLKEDAGYKKLEIKKRLILFGKNVLDTCEEEPYLMEFLFFGPYTTPFYQSVMKEESPLRLLEEYRKLVKELAMEYGLADKEEDLFVRLWSFLQGYSLLVQNKVVPYDNEFMEETVNSFLEH